MNHPKTGDEELELLVKAERAYANRTEEFCNDYKSWMAGARSVVRAAQSETELLRKRVEKFREALTLIEYVDNHGGVNQYRSCAEIAKEALEKIK